MCHGPPNSETEELWKQRKWHQQDFNSHFKDICKYEATISLFSVPPDINVETVPTKFQIERINLQCDICPISIFNMFSTPWLPQTLTYLLISFQCLVTIHSKYVYEQLFWTADITQHKPQMNEWMWSIGGMIMIMMGKPNYWETDLSQYHFVHQKWHMN